MPLPSLRPLRDTRAAYRFWRGFRTAHPDLFPLSDALQGFSRLLEPQRLRHWLGGRQLRSQCVVTPDPTHGYRVEVRPLGLSFFWPSLPDCDTWYALEQEVWSGHPHCYTTAPIRLGPQATVLDVGACEGLFAFRLLKSGLARRVIAFEPFPAMADLLREGARFNGLGAELQHEPFAVAARSGRVGFRTDLGADSSQVVEDPPADFPGVRVEAVSLDDYVARTGLKLGPGDLLKVDAEGADWDVLKGAEQLIREHAPQVAVTTYHTDRHAAEITEWLRAVQPKYRLRLKGFAYWTPVPRPVLLQASTLAP
jgi:FkbM family methyltransferase